MSYGITHAAMESTGEYWKPIYNIWKTIRSLLVNAQPSSIPEERRRQGLEWIAELLHTG